MQVKPHIESNSGTTTISATLKWENNPYSNQEILFGSMPFPVEIDFSTNMTVAPVVAGDSRHQGALW